MIIGNQLLKGGKVEFNGAYLRPMKNFKTSVAHAARHNILLNVPW